MRDAPLFLNGDLVRLRPVDERDVDLAARVANDPELRPNLRFKFPATREAERAWVLNRPATEVVFAIVPRGTEAGVGLVGLHGIDRVHAHAELGVAIAGEENRGRGWGGEAVALVLAYAFDELNLERVWLHVKDGNPSRALYARLGFREEGRLRAHEWAAGGRRDVVAMGLLRAEWEALRARPRR